MHAAVRYFCVLGSCAAVLVSSAYATDTSAKSTQDKNSVKVPGGLGFDSFKGYESWETIGLSTNAKLTAVILGNPTMIAAYKAGIPGNGKPFPDGAKMAKIHWNPQKNAFFPDTTGPGTLHDVDFMEKDSKRFADSGGWGYAAFQYDNASGTFKPSTTSDQPPQANDAKCGAACHTIVKNKDFVFTDYAIR